MLLTARLPSSGVAAPFPGSKQRLIDLRVPVEDEKGKVSYHDEGSATLVFVSFGFVLPAPRDIVLG
jgi:hypothetical protein